MPFRQGDRVRIKDPLSEYTGSRGTVMIDASDQPEGVLALGYFVAIDGENGRTRPFLVRDLERLQVARVGARSVPGRPAISAENGRGEDRVPTKDD